MSATLRAADLAIANLETAITERGTPAAKQFTFRAPPTAFDALSAAGVDAAIMANNHALDYGRTGLSDTLAAAAARNYPVLGIGKNADAAYAGKIFTIRGIRVAVLALSDIRELADDWAATDDRAGIATTLNLARSTAAIRAARAQADAVIVYLHWGVEGQHCPTPTMRALARALSQAGADALVSTHAHLMLGDGWLGSTYVSYGLGNFLWWRDDAFSNDTGVLTLTFRGRSVVRAVLSPARISHTGQPVPATGRTADRISREYLALRPCAGLADSPSR